MQKRLWLSGFLCIVSTIAFGGDWNQYQGGITHTGYVSGNQNPAAFSVKWQRVLDPRYMVDAPVTWNGKVFISEDSSSQDPSLWALDAATGTTLWSQQYLGSSYISQPTLDNGNLYFQSTKGPYTNSYFYSLDASNGNLNYRTQFNTPWNRFYSPTVVNGRSYINGGWFGGLMAYDNASGNQLWANFDLPMTDSWTPTILGNTAYAFLGAGVSGLYEFDLSTGTTINRIDDPNFEWDGYSMRQSVVPDGIGGMLATNGGRLIHFNLATQAIDYEISDNISGQVSVANGVAYALRNNGVSAFQVSDGQLLWSWNPGGSEFLWTKIIVSDSHLYVGSDTSTYAINLTSHESEFSYGMTGNYSLTGDTLYISSYLGHVDAISIVPEPGTIFAVGIGVAGLTRVRRRRSASKG